MGGGSRLTAYITNSHAPITHYSVCPVCGGWVAFNLAELEARRAKGQNTSIYCAGGAQLADGQYDRSREHWHPSFPPDAIAWPDAEAEI